MASFMTLSIYSGTLLARFYYESAPSMHRARLFNLEDLLGGAVVQPLELFPGGGTFSAKLSYGYITSSISKPNFRHDLVEWPDPRTEFKVRAGNFKHMLRHSTIVVIKRFKFKSST